MGRCDEPELNADSMGWEHMPLDIFDPDEFNNSDISVRYGLTVDAGVRWNKNYLMITGKDFREKLEEARNARSEENVLRICTEQEERRSRRS